VTPPADRTYDELKRRLNLYRLRMQKLWIRFRREADGQDLLEYTFLLAVILLASVALMMNIAPGANKIWAQTGFTLDQWGGAPTAARPSVTDSNLPIDSIKKASPEAAASSTPEVIVAGVTVAVLSWLLWYAEISEPASPDQLPTPQPEKPTQAMARWRRRPTDSDGPLAS